jgi:hypothetical protein
MANICAFKGPGDGDTDEEFSAAEWEAANAVSCAAMNGQQV